MKALLFCIFMALLKISYCLDGTAEKFKYDSDFATGFVMLFVIGLAVLSAMDLFGFVMKLKE